MIRQVLKQRSHKLAVVGSVAALAVTGGTAYGTSTATVKGSGTDTVGLARAAAGDVRATRP
jgi:hypothetical protein